MKYMMTLLALVAAAATVSGQSGAANPLIGAWKVESAQPGLYIFTKQHYSFSRVQGEPLPDYPSNDKATDAQKVAVFNTLYLNSGTYTVTGNMLATKAMMAKSKFAIGGGGNQYEFAVSGNSLTLTQKPSGAVLKLTRLE
ncbi:MAG TPA: hypothetical protein VFU28_05115 [Vicinamibacterales bacterium]|nr:hypothetical protein [Vicinamibacterales bacterium]